VDLNDLDANTQTAIIKAIDKSQATIEFGLDGTIITANDNFLQLMGYTLEELKGHHHRIFCEASYAESLEYKKFWEQLNRGDYDRGEYKRLSKHGEAVYIQATYNPIFDKENKLVKILKIASDVTEQKRASAEFEGKMSAIDKSQGVIEFELDGTIITANDNFLQVIGYSLEEVKGQHHRIFCDESYVESLEYKAFWEKLNRGEFDAGEYKRRGKNGNDIYIQAAYNPILDLEGKPFKIVKIATDITARKRMDAERTKQAALILEMSTPVMRLWDNILLLPIVGLVDSKRVQMIMESVLEKILDYQAKVIILDIQGVPSVDSAVANHLIKVTKAAKLMGCACIITGISPEISQALVNLGIELTDILTQATLKDGVNTSLKSVGYALKSNNSAAL
jgi:methyl-accepting chemotaxis protein